MNRLAIVLAALLFAYQTTSPAQGFGETPEGVFLAAVNGTLGEVARENGFLLEEEATYFSGEPIYTARLLGRVGLFYARWWAGGYAGGLIGGKLGAVFGPGGAGTGFLVGAAAGGLFVVFRTFIEMEDDTVAEYLFDGYVRREVHYSVRDLDGGHDEVFEGSCFFALVISEGIPGPCEIDDCDHGDIFPQDEEGRLSVDEEGATDLDETLGRDRIVAACHLEDS